MSAKTTGESFGPPTTGSAATDMASGDADDVALMQHIAAGDQPAFRRFAARHVPRCLALAQRILGNAADAEEVVQDALLRLWQQAPNWRAGEAKVSTWLYRVLVNLAIDRTRQRRHRFVALDEAGDPADPAPSAQNLVETRQLEAALDAAIRALPERQRLALSLCGQDGLSCAEAAEVLKISVSAMESLLVRGRRTLRWQLARLGLVEEIRRREAAPERSRGARFPLAAIDFSAMVMTPALA